MKIIMTKGLPGSGKSTWARQMLEKDGSMVLVCKDDLRAMMFNSAWTGNREKFILKMRDLIISSALENKRNVIVHDTNLAPKHEIRFREIAKTYNAEFEVKDFTDVPIEKCIEQDLRRVDSVGERVIRDMWRDWLKPKILVPEIQYQADFPFAIICDLDGTLALFGDRNPYERDFSQDIVNKQVHELLLRMKKKYNIIIVSGRNGKFKDVTLKWLDDHGIPYDSFHMRPEGDTRKDSILKKEIYETKIKPKYNVWMVIDDRNQVVEMWRSLGLTCLQVADGDF